MKNKKELLHTTAMISEKLQKDISKIEESNRNFRTTFESDPSMNKFLKGWEENEEITEELKDTAKDFQALIEEIKKL